MTSTEAETQHVISNLRACLLSVKGGIPIQSLDRDYRVLIGQNIPYRKLGFDSLEKFLKSIPDVSISRSRTGEVILDAIPTKSTKHLADLIARQKSAPKKIRPPRTTTRRTAASQWRPPPSSSRRNFDDSYHGRRAPLSVTVHNVSRVQRFDKAERTVKISPDSRPESRSDSRPEPRTDSRPEHRPDSRPEHRPDSRPEHRSSVSSRGRGISQTSRPSYAFEVPPRFLKLSMQDTSTNKVQSQAPFSPSDHDPPATLQIHSSPVASPIASPTNSDCSQGQRSVDSFPSSTGIPRQSPLPVIRPSVSGTAVNSGAPSVAVNNDSSRTLSSYLANGNGPSPLLNYPALKSRSRRKRYSEEKAKMLLSKVKSGLLPSHKVPRVIPVVEKELEDAPPEQPNYREELRRICRLLHLEEPSFSVVPRFPNGGEVVIYGCIVKVGEYSYNSYPEEHHLPGEAARIVAQIALEDLKKIHESALGEHPLPETCNRDAWMKRVAMIVLQYPNGVWSTQIPVDYKEKYFEVLPGDWVSQMAECPFVTMDHIGDNRIIIFPNENCGDMLNAIAASTPAAKLEPEPLVLPASENWDVFVTSATSTSEVWFRLIGEGYSVAYESMALDMEMLYADKENVASKPEVGCLYALVVDGCWHRVRLESIDELGASVFFIDHGDMEQAVSLGKLHILEPQFITLPAQAVQCSLYGLEDFVDDPNASKHLIDIVGKTLIAEVRSRGTEEDPVIRVILYDTSSEDDINLNQMLVEKISRDVNAPQLPQTGDIVDAHISHISDTGDLYIQIDSDSFNYLETLISQVIETAFTPENLKLARNHRNATNKLYLAKYSVDNRYYRAKIIEVYPSDEVKVFFVDYGNTETIPSSDLLLLDVLSETLEYFPPQAIKVNLYNVPPESFNPKLLDRVHELLPENDEPVLIKMIETVEPAIGAEELPLVEVFRRICDSNQLVSINNTLLVDPNFKKPAARRYSSDDSYGHKSIVDRMRGVNAGSISPDSSCSSTLSRQNSQHNVSENGEQVPPRSLSAPAIPEIRNYFDVHVTMAANPSNFTVQPYTERHKLERLMSDIQEYYSSWPCPIKPPDTVIEGGLYAALYDDGYFYRVCVSNVIGGNMVSVYFSDFGDVAVLAEDKLQPLADRFKDLPYQAIKAKLSGIQPSHSDWSVEDCLRFQEIVVEHVFVSVVMERGPDLLNPSDTCLGLQLIDTTGDKDIKIDQLLVDEGRAIFI